MYERGDVVLLPFPFTDLSAARTRPAVVVSTDAFARDTGDFTVAMITSVPHTSAYDYALSDWQAAHLLRPSWVRAKLATLDPALVRYQPGRLSDADLAEVERRLRRSLGLL
jgi:mRNA interferase MazF